MKRVIFGLIGMFFVFALSSKSAYANEGVLNLRGSGAGSCYTASIYIDGAYRILMTCRELRIALSPEKNRYVAWVEGEGVDAKQKRLGEIVNGKLNTISDIKFTKIFITSEEDSYGNKPLGEVLLVGGVEPIDFGKGVVLTPSPTALVTGAVTPTVTKKATATPKPTTATSGTTSQSGLGSALSTIFKIGLFGFGLLLVVVGVFSFLQRRRSL